ALAGLALAGCLIAVAVVRAVVLDGPAPPSAEDRAMVHTLRERATSSGGFLPSTNSAGGAVLPWD
ncbi:MAG: hypothetical protein K8E66_13635, partial [Phycisphaerales bacterium]|nr:hypothetical protein [Phycisphaerales bacterium]